MVKKPAPLGKCTLKSCGSLSGMTATIAMWAISKFTVNMMLDCVPKPKPQELPHILLLPLTSLSLVDTREYCLQANNNQDLACVHVAIKGLRSVLLEVEVKYAAVILLLHWHSFRQFCIPTTVMSPACLLDKCGLCDTILPHVHHKQSTHMCTHH